jgi:uncharacterized protein
MAVVRPVTPADLPRLLEINQANVPAVGSVDLDRLGFLVAESPIALAVELDAELVGFCLVLAADSAYDSVNYRWFTERHDRFMYLDRVAFDAAARRKGLGTLLYGELDRLLRERGDVDHLALGGQHRPAERGFTALPRRARFRRGRPAGHAVRHPGVDADAPRPPLTGTSHPHPTIS